MGPNISHLCFADDMLFTKASEVQMGRVLHCFKLFGDSSGQKVSIAKTKIYFSKNVSSMLERAISHKSGFLKRMTLKNIWESLSCIEELMSILILLLLRTCSGS